MSGIKRCKIQSFTVRMDNAMTGETKIEINGFQNFVDGVEVTDPLTIRTIVIRSCIGVTLNLEMFPNLETFVTIDTDYHQIEGIGKLRFLRQVGIVLAGDREIDFLYDFFDNNNTVERFFFEGDEKQLGDTRCNDIFPNLKMLSMRTNTGYIPKFIYESTPTKIMHLQIYTTPASLINVSAKFPCLMLLYLVSLEGELPEAKKDALTEAFPMVIISGNGEPKREGKDITPRKKKRNDLDRLVFDVLYEFRVC